jgi:flagellin-like hook-associated protein FlgL
LIERIPGAAFTGGDGTFDLRGNPPVFPPSPLPVTLPTRAEVLPVFTLSDGQVVPRDMVIGDAVNGFHLKIGLLVQKSQAGGITLADLLGRTSAANPKFDMTNIISDNSGNHQYTLTASGVNRILALGPPYNTWPIAGGSALTSGYARALFQAVNTLTNVNANDLFDLVKAGFILFDAAFSASNTAGLVDYYNQYPVRYEAPGFVEGASRFCIDDEIYYIGSATLGREAFTSAKTARAISLSALVSSAGFWNSNANPFGSGRNWETIWAISALAFAVNNNPTSKFWARLETGGAGEYREGYTSLYVYSKEGGDKHNLTACDEQLGEIRGNEEKMNAVRWYNDEVEADAQQGTYFNNGGQYWGTLRAIPTGYGSWGVQLHGRDVGDDRDLWILNVGEMDNADIQTGQKKGFTGVGFGTYANGRGVNNLNGLDRQAFMEIQDAADGPWAGAHVRTQSDAQESLDAIRDAIERKDKVRATLGAYINRLENTITNLEIQAENLQASESRISDVDMALEMTNFVRNQVLTQAAVSMLSQANSLPQMALSLLNS